MPNPLNWAVFQEKSKQGQGEGGALWDINNLQQPLYLLDKLAIPE